VIYRIQTGVCRGRSRMNVYSNRNATFGSIRVAFRLGK
jgi:hypothetical protein